MMGLSRIQLLARRRQFAACICCLQNRLVSTAPNRKGVGIAYMTYERYTDSLPKLQPLVILHGLMGSKTNWQSLAKVFGKTGRMVVTVDARNHGESVHTEDINYFLMRDDLLRLMDDLEIGQAVLLGHSMGGKVAMTTALTQPDRVSGLVVADISPMPSPSAGTVPAFLQAMLRISLDLQETSPDVPPSTVRMRVVEALAEVVEESAVRHFLSSNLIQKDNKYQWRVNLDAIINNFSDISGFPDFGHEQYYGSTFFVGGAKSDYIRDVHLPLILSMFPNASVHHIEGAGHWVHADRPHQFIEVVNDFFEESGL